MSKLIDITGLAEFRRKSKAEHDALASLVDDIMFILDIQYPLTFTATENSTIGIKLNGSNMGWSNVQYSINNGAWRDYTLAASANMISLAKGSNIKWRANKDGQNQSDTNYIQFVMTGKLEGSGNITSMLNGVGGVQSLVPYGTRTFAYLFKGCVSLTEAPAIPSTTLTEHCYRGMLQDCTSLIAAPSLPATNLSLACYVNMFQGCSSLVSAPALLATTLAASCYQQMFMGCVSLTAAPAISATTLAPYCCYMMFQNCKKMVDSPSELPATTLADNCYQQMFLNCKLMVTAPALPATTLANNCYQKMFEGCAALKTAPTLPATTLTDYCYNNMFSSCIKCNEIHCAATDISAVGCVGDWLNGVSATGDFYTPSATEWPSGTSGIPSGWTRHNE